MSGSTVVSEGLACKSEKGPSPDLVVVTTQAVDDANSPNLLILNRGLLAFGLERRGDGLIYWRRDSADHPRNWSTWRKTFDTTIIILLEFYT